MMRKYHVRFLWELRLVTDGCLPDALQLMRSIYRANKHQNRAEHLEVFLDELELLKLEIRLCVDMKLMPMRKQALLSELLEKIGKQVTGWRNAAR